MNEQYNPKLKSNARALRKNLTKEERHLWYDCFKLLPVTVQRQKAIGPYIVDFYIASAKIVIELDGSQHYDPKARQRDSERTRVLESRGLTVIRIPNNEVNQNFRGVCEYIDHLVQTRILSNTPYIYERNFHI